jgi:hypothetical protein
MATHWPSVNVCSPEPVDLFDRQQLSELEAPRVGLEPTTNGLTVLRQQAADQGVHGNLQALFHARCTVSSDSGCGSVIRAVHGFERRAAFRSADVSPANAPPVNLSSYVTSSPAHSGGLKPSKSGASPRSTSSIRRPAKAPSKRRRRLADHRRLSTSESWSESAPATRKGSHTRTRRGRDSRRLDSVGNAR